MRGALRLDRILKERAPLKPPVLIELGIRICEAVQRTWDNDDQAPGGTERELMPCTIFVGLDGSVSAEDIGLSDLEATAGDPSAVYKAPESIEGHGGIGADVFVLTAILFEMATGEPLFKGRRAESGEQMTKGLQRRLSAVGIPNGLDRRIGGFGSFLQRGLQLDRRHRYPNPVAMGRQLKLIRNDATIDPVDLAEFFASSPAGEAEPAPEAEVLSVELETEDKPPEPQWTLAAESVPGTNPFNIQEAALDDRVEAARADPWQSDDETEQDIVKRMTARRLTPVERTGQHKLPEEEPTFMGAVRWFIGRVLLVLLLVCCILFAIGYFGCFPGGTERIVASGWERVPEAVRESVPESWVTGVQGWWAERPGQEVGRGVGGWALGVMPEDWRRTLAEEPPTPPPTAGTPTADGVVASVEGWIEPVADGGDGSGRLKLTIDYAGRARGSRVAVVATRADGTGEPIEWTAESAQALPASHYDLALRYQESTVTEPLVGTIAGVVVAAGHATTYVVGLDAPYGFLDAEIALPAEGDFEGGDVTRQVTLSGWPETGERPTEPPAWSLPAGPLIGLEPGVWRVRAVLEEEGRAPSVAWFSDVRVAKGDRTLVRRTDMRRGEPLDPTGPGVRIAATNYGEDVSESTVVFVFAAGANRGGAVAAAQGPAGYYFDVPIGTWDIQLVYTPDPTDPSLRATRLLERVVIDPGQIVRRTEEMNLAVSFVDVRVTAGDEDLSDEVRVLGLNPGASFEGATRLFDTEGPGAHAVHPDTYDVYVQVTVDGVWRTAAFKDVELGAGATWKRRLDAATVRWMD